MHNLSVIPTLFRLGYKILPSSGMPDHRQCPGRDPFTKNHGFQPESRWNDRIKISCDLCTLELSRYPGLVLAGTSPQAARHPASRITGSPQVGTQKLPIKVTVYRASKTRKTKNLLSEEFKFIYSAAIDSKIIMQPLDEEK